MVSINLFAFMSILKASSKCQGELEVCCQLPNNNNAKLIDPDLEIEVKISDEPKIVHNKYESKCGQRNIHGVGVNIINLSDNSSAQFGEWTHVCAIVSHPTNPVSIFIQHLYPKH